MRWYILSRQLAKVQHETEENRLADIAETKTEVLQPMPRLSAHALLFGEDDERHTDEVETMLVETEKRPVVGKAERVEH